MQERAMQTRTQILDAAMGLFSGAGYDATSVAAICAAAGVSKGAFYHHFPSKQALFIELLNRWLDGLDAQMDAIGATALSVPEALQHMAGLLRRVYEDASGQIPMFLEFLSRARLDPAVWRATVEPFRRYRERFARLVARGIASGELRPVDPDTAAQTLVSVAVGLVLQSALGDDETDWGRTAQECVGLILSGWRAGGC